MARARRINELWVVCGLYSEQWSKAIGEMVRWKTRMNYVGIKNADFEDEFLLLTLTLNFFTMFSIDLPQIAMCLY